MTTRFRHTALFLLFLLSPALHAGETATFAGGCFWCVEEAFDKVPGVIATTSGFANGGAPNPTYDQVSAGGTGYVEAVQVEFDPERVSYTQLLQTFWRNHDPLDGRGQFCDRGDQYRPAIIYHDDAQRQQANASLASLRQEQPFKGDIITPVEPFKNFYPAEEYHQDFHNKNPLRYKFYKYNCGRPARLEQLWGKPE
ncbi:MAG: peptide-methionine (S)-S-oxide reductase [Gammaproteobacteria bacterium HGW-Gammaproteobacteria-1]|jgi:peptide-methionine (S)-S-oxide reductase|nr:MAG: peptide-methionine (S)-S-oxide reductase [Gammaproteobacteria bacterium HGW-Gammaproteobacteria-1]